MAKEPTKDLSVLQMNVCLPPWNFAHFAGGTCKDETVRVKEISELILKENPDIVCLQETYDIESSYSIVKNLSDSYATFYMHIGTPTLVVAMPSGLFVASKMPISNPEFTSFERIPHCESMVKKGIFSFSTSQLDWMATHFSPSPDDTHPSQESIEARRDEQSLVLERAKSQERPLFLVGDLNIVWGAEEYYSSPLFQKAADSYNQGREEVSGKDSTWEGTLLTAKNWLHIAKEPNKMILDYALSLGKEVDFTTKKVDTFNLEKPEEAITDHAALLTTISIDTV
ncbi:MAG: smcL [Parachlamydiales bacterium]|nr:smcL [Parachlamydiales bacterium]